MGRPYCLCFCEKKWMTSNEWLYFNRILIPLIYTETSAWKIYTGVTCTGTREHRLLLRPEASGSFKNEAWSCQLIILCSGASVSVSFEVISHCAAVKNHLCLQTQNAHFCIIILCNTWSVELQHIVIGRLICPEEAFICLTGWRVLKLRCWTGMSRMTDSRGYCWWQAAVCGPCSWSLVSLLVSCLGTY